jgi:hypothetical protein
MPLAEFRQELPQRRNVLRTNELNGGCRAEVASAPASIPQQSGIALMSSGSGGTFPLVSMRMKKGDAPRIQDASPRQQQFRSGIRLSGPGSR